MFGLFQGDGKIDAGELGFAEEPTVSPAGVYQVRVRVIEAKDLSAINSFSLYQSLVSFSWKTNVESGDRLPNAIAKVRLNRDGFKTEKRKTAVEKETATPLWNQQFYFDGVDVAEGELEACTITITACDKSRIGSDRVIGTCDLNLAAVYQEEGHELWQEWLTLTDQSQRRQGSQGQVCVCVSVLRAGDEPAVHGDGEDDDGGLGLGAPPAADNVKPKTYLLKAQLYSGRDLPRMDRFGRAGVDAYLKLQCGSAKPVRSRSKTSRSPDWNQEVLMRLVVPPGKGGLASLPPLKMSLMDYDLGRTDDHIASKTVGFRELITNPQEFQQPRWYSFYGGPREMELKWFTKVSKLAKRMNAGYIEGSAYRGRVLMSMKLIEETDWNKGTIRPKQKIPSVLDNLGKEWPVYLHAEVYSLELNQSRHVGSRATVSFNIGLNSLKSPSKTLRSEGKVLGKECYANFNYRLSPMRIKLPTPFEGPLAGQGAPDLFIDVSIGGKRIGYCRVPCSRLMPVNEEVEGGPHNPPPSEEDWKIQGWFQLHADAIGDHKRGESRRAEHVKPMGQVLLRINLCGSTVTKLEARSLSPEELEAQEDEESDNDDIEKAPGEEGRDARAAKIEKRMEAREERMGEDTCKIDALRTVKYMLQAQVYQAKNLPAGDAQGASDPFAVIRCGRSKAETHVCKATTNPAWFREMLMEVELPVVPAPRPKKQSKKQARMGVEEDSSDEEGDEDEADVEAGAGHMSMAQANARGIHPGANRLPQVGFEGIAWWAVPKMTVIVFDHDEGMLGSDNDALSVCSLPLIHPNARPKKLDKFGKEIEEDAPLSTLASSASQWTDAGIDDVPDDFADLSKYRVGISEPEWYNMFQLNPSRAGGVDVRPGGQILLHYTLKDVPKEGIFRYCGMDPPKVKPSELAKGYYPKVVRSLGDFFGSNPVEVQVMLLGVRGMEPYKGVPIGAPCVEVELSGALPLFPGAPFLTAQSEYSSNPNGPNANFNGQILCLRGRVHRMTKIELSLSIRIYDSRPIKRLVGTGQHRILIRDEDEEDESGKKPKKLRAVKPKPMTPEELRELEIQGMESTDSEEWIGSSDATSIASDSTSETATEDEFSDDEEHKSWFSQAGSSFLSMARSAYSIVGSVKSERSSKRGGSRRSGSRRSKSRRGESEDGERSDFSKYLPASVASGLSKARSVFSKGDGSAKSGKSARSGRSRRSGRSGRSGKSGAGKRKKALSVFDMIPEGEEGEENGAASVDDGKTTMSGEETTGETTDGSEPEPEEEEEKKDGSGSDDDGSDEEESDEEEIDMEEFDDGSGTVPEFMDGRKMVTDGELEDHMRPLPFITVPIMRSKGFADNTSDLVEGGKLKFVCRVVPLSEHEEEPAEKLLDKGGFNPFGNKKKKEEEAEIERKNAAYKCEDDAATMPLTDFKKLQRLIGGGSKALLPQSVIVRAFVVRGKNIRPLDPSGLCDPYMKVDLLGTGKRFGNRRDHVKETLAPWFYKMFQFTTELPGSSQLQFKLYDWDKNGGDDVIGVNTVDLEDRWFSPIWKSQFSETPPLELRTLLNNDATGSQGSLELWVEMYEADENVPRAMKIAPPPVIDVELRVVIWRARKMVIKDIGGNNDLFFKVGLVGLDHKQTRFGQVQETDTHYFASDGKGSFNYRIIYRFSIPVTKAKLRVSAYDRDLIGSNDNIGEAILPLSGMCNDLMRVIQAAPDGELSGNAEVKMDAKNQKHAPPMPKDPPFLSCGEDGVSVNFPSMEFGDVLDAGGEGHWSPLYHPSKDDRKQGEVEVSLTLLPVRRADQRPVGKARDQPNRDPELPAPIRAKLNPFDPIGSLITIMGPNMARNIILALCILACLAVCCSLAVFIINDVLSAYINIAIQQATGAGGGMMPAGGGLGK